MCDPRRFEFCWDLVGDAAPGRPDPASSSPVEVYRLIQSYFRDILEQNFGPVKSHEILYAAGRLAGAEWYGHLVPQTDLYDLLLQFQSLLREMGFGVSLIEGADLAKGDLTLSVTRDPDCSGMPDRNPICVHEQGFIAALLEGLTGKPVRVAIGNGDLSASFATQAYPAEFLNNAPVGLEHLTSPTEMTAVLTDMTASKQLEDENRRLRQETLRLTTTDALTGCVNRRHFQDLALGELARAHRYRRPLSLLLLDIDNLEPVNDRYGHPVGDEILQRLADLCRANIRHIDILGRYAGDEFAILMPETPVTTVQPAAQDARAVAERLCRQIAQAPYATQAGVMHVTISLGIAGLTGNATDASEQRRPGAELEILLRHANHALYAAKEAGGNRVQLYRETRPDGDL